MKPLENAWNGLVQRKLLPLAILLLAAIVAIPFLLAKDPEPLPAAPASPSAAAGSKAEDSIAKPVVSQVDENATAARRRVLGAQKNPFEPAKAPKPKATPAPVTTGAAATTGATTAPSASGGSVAGAGAGSSAPSATTPASAPSAPAATPEPVAKAPVKQTYTVYSAVVRYGNPAEGEPQQKTLTRLTPLPDSTAPAVLYFGVGPDDKNEKAAYFYIADNAELEDDTLCRPSVRSCQGIILGVGKKAKLNILDKATGDVTGSYEIELVKIKSKHYDSAEKAKDAYDKASKAGRRVLRAYKSAAGPLRYRYEAKSGLVRKLDKRAYKALLAKSARVALGTAGGF